MQVIVFSSQLRAAKYITTFNDDMGIVQMTRCHGTELYDAISNVFRAEVTMLLMPGSLLRVLHASSHVLASREEVVKISEQLGRAFLHACDLVRQ